ncbi:Pten 2 [Anopheles sinensis]|uniref:Pten 2 n=1 Tax=Anopheles sinensis TaxID=74873 RepID=A0A084WFM1_ANOSI|nr:Pten 2 [Anopheles sinensis]
MPECLADTRAVEDVHRLQPAILQSKRSPNFSRQRYLQQKASSVQKPAGWQLPLRTSPRQPPPNQGSTFTMTTSQKRLRPAVANGVVRRNASALKQ